MLNLDWRVLVSNYAPRFRVVFWLDWFSVLLSPLKEKYESFKTWRLERLEEIQYSSQTIALENLLQEKFQAATITITNNIIENRLMVLAPSRFKSASNIDYGNQAADLPRLAFGGAVEQVQYHFTINAPTDLQHQEHEMNMWIRKYAHTGFLWNFNYN